MPRTDDPEGEFDPAPTGQMPTIHLLVSDDANRRVLGEWLADVGDWTVDTAVAGPTDVDDLVVVDAVGLRANRATISSWKAETDAFRPCLLVSERGEAALDGDDSGVVNDVVELPTSKSTLERRIERLLSEREQSRQLAADRGTLREQNERLRMFAGRLAHDLRNPLGIAMGYLEQARSSGDDHDFQIIDDALARVERLIDETLMLAKMGETAVDREQLDLESVARRAWGHVETGDATLSVAGDARFEADESRLEELFENCFRNAVEHAGADAAVNVAVLDERDGFCVEDDGPGIPESDREQVFEVGYTTHEDGTGFGLRIVQEIAEAHGWRVAADESRQGGARITVSGVDIQ